METQMLLVEGREEALPVREIPFLLSMQVGAVILISAATPVLVVLADPHCHRFSITMALALPSCFMVGDA